MNHQDENMDMISALSERLLNGIFKENPTFVLLLGMCPTLAVTTSAVNGLGMGASTMIVLAMSNLLISLLRKVIPNKIRIPAFIVIIASFVTIVELVMKGYVPSLYSALGLYIPLIVVNCIILGRAESYAYSHSALLSLFDGLGMGMGFTIALTLIGAFRELLGSGKVFNAQVMPEGFIPVSIFVMAPGAFFVLAMLTAVQNKIKEIGTARGRDMSKIQSGCGGNCFECDKECKVSALPSADAEETGASTETVKPDTAVDTEGGSENTETEADPDEAKEDDIEKSVSHKGFAERFKERFARKSGKTGEEPSQGDKTDGETAGEGSESDKEKEPEGVDEKSDTGEQGPEEVHKVDSGLGGPDQESGGPEQEGSVGEPEEPSQKPEGSVEEREEPSQECGGTEEELRETDDRAAEEQVAQSVATEVEMWDLSDMHSTVRRDLPSGRRPGKSRKAMERAKAMLDRAGAAKEDSNG